MKRGYRKGVFIVVYRIEKGRHIYLLLKRKLHWTGWEFPKGGIESNEPAMIAVKREVKEETGQKPAKIISFRISGKYKYNKKFEERLGYKGQIFSLFAAEIKSKKIKFDKKEHSDYCWLEFKDAEKKLAWPNQRKCLEIVDKELR